MFLKSVLKKRLLSILLLLMICCAKELPEKSWSSPFDPHGTNYHPPQVTAKSDTVLAVNDTILLVADGFDKNGTITGHCWSFDGGKSWDTASISTPFMKSWGPLETGLNTVLYRTMDNDGLVSPIDSFTVMVQSFAPVLTPVSDTIAGQRAIVVVNFEAIDTVGKVIRYFIKTDTISRWSDSSDSPQFSISNREGGSLQVIWAVMDDDYNVVSDSFNIFFNQGPDSAFLNRAANFETFDFNEYAGTLPLNFSGTDPDGDSDILHYTLFIGTGTPTEVYNGKGTEFLASEILPSASYNWILRVKDLFGDSIEVSGKITTPKHPPGPPGMKFVQCKNLSFSMGQNEFADYEKPVHSVSFSYHFWIDSTEITSEDFAALTGTSQIENGIIPKTAISWFDAALYCNERSKRDSLDTVYIYTNITGNVGEGCTVEALSIDMNTEGYRLPTEAEWEYACRARSATPFYWGNSPLIASDYAWTKSNSANAAQPVALKKPNALRLYDMAGNVWEWCNDWFDTSYYSISPATDPTGPESGFERVIRGGSWMHSDYFLQSGTRSKMPPAKGNATIGFRAVLQVR